MNTIFFLLLILVWPLSLIFPIVTRASKSKEKSAAAKWFTSLSLLFALGYLTFLGLNLFCDDLWLGRLTVPSPTGEYALEQRFTDFLTIGYRGRTYLVVDGDYYKVGNIGPGGVTWTDEDSFSLGYGKDYTISDFLP